ncbi:MAG TPA: methylenetetrahydrofolate reductase [Alphaproteobacteria bacterium]|nr:methylenetetrahydrofolate reductase [Alphaproteobacteria bacterium]
MSDYRLSFEFLPIVGPPDMSLALPLGVQRLCALRPVFGTVTFGAGGTDFHNTGPSAEFIQRETGLPIAAHLTIINLTKDEVLGFARDFRRRGITRLVVLSGERREGWQPPDYSEGRHFQYVNEAVEALRREKDLADMEIAVAVAPENSRAASPAKAAVEDFQRKIDAGADRGITQFFRSNVSFTVLCEAAVRAGIKKPIIPGFMPLYGPRTVEIMEASGVPVAAMVKNEVLAAERGAPARAVAQKYLATQLEDFMQRHPEQKDLQFFSLSRADVIVPVCTRLGLAPALPGPVAAPRRAALAPLR